jgi:hypothetical protein
MTRSFRACLAFCLLVALPLASIVASGHVHPRAGGPPASCSGGACVEGAGVTSGAAATAAPPLSATAAGGEQPLCPTCELAKSLHATGLASTLILPGLERGDQAPVGPTPDSPDPRFVDASSRSPPPC